MTTIALDIDDVIADSTESLRVQVNQVTGRFLTSDDYREPGEYSRYYEKVWQRHNLSVTYDELHTDMASDQSHIHVLKGAKEAIKQLSRNHNLVSVTARDPSWRQATVKWLNEEFPGIFQDVVFTSHEANIKKHRTKGSLCKYIGATVLVDDNPEHCESALQQGVESILFGVYGWHTFIPEDVVRCENWQEVREYFANADG